MSADIIKQSFLEAKELLSKYISDENNFHLISNAGEKIVDAIKSGNKIISCGNGGSMSDAMHFAEELSGRFRDERRALPAIAISDSSHITCTANDHGYDYIFSRFIEALGNSGDILIAISTSGNSQNVINAATIAKNKKMEVIALTGKNGGKLASLCDIEIRVPHFGYADRIQEIHIKILHTLIQYIENKLF